MQTCLLPADIDTSRLRLRRPEPRDLADLYAVYSDPDVARWLNWRVYTDEPTLWADIEKLTAQWQEGTEYYWVIECDGVVIGSIACGVNGKDADIGFMLGTRYSGHGYATEAASEVLRLISGCGRIERIVALAAVENTASIAVLEKLAMQRKGIAAAFMTCPNVSDEPVDAVIYAFDCVRNVQACGELAENH